MRLLALKRGDVIATGGGLPCRDGRPEALRAIGTVVWLARRLRHALRAGAARGRAADAGRARRATRSRRSTARASPTTARPTSRWTPPASTPTRSSPSSCSLAARRSASALRSPLGERAGRGAAVDDALAPPRPPAPSARSSATAPWARCSTRAASPLDACFDVLNLNEPKLVQSRARRVHRGGLRRHRDEYLRGQPLQAGHPRPAGAACARSTCAGPSWRATCARAWAATCWCWARSARSASTWPRSAASSRRTRARRSTSRRRGCSRAASTPS